MKPFVFHVHDRRTAEPLVLEVTVASRERAVELAEERLTRSADYRLVEVWLENVLIFTARR